MSNELDHFELLPNWKWTDKQPTKYGHHWFRHTEGHSPRILEVFHDEADGEDSVRLGDFAEDVNYLANYQGQWCGPIPAPNEEQK